MSLNVSQLQATGAQLDAVIAAWQALLAGTLKGEKGNPGQDGYTPIKGVDYYTAVDNAEVAALAAASIQPGVAAFIAGGAPVDNTLYVLDVDSALSISASTADSCPVYGAHLVLTFTSGGSVTASYSSYVGDDITEAASGEVWEVSILRGNWIVKNMSA